jgi:hypothetical protein
MGAIAVLLAGGIASASAADKPRSPHRRTMVFTGERGRLGVLVEDVTSDDVQRLRLDLEAGVRVRSVEEDSPAAAAGLKEDDVVVRYQAAALVAPVDRVAATTVLQPGTLDPNPAIRGLVADLMTKDPGTPVAELRRLLRDGIPRVRFFAAAAILKRPIPPA